MVAAAEAEAQKRNVQVTICIVDESGNLLFLQKADGATLNTIGFAQKKARYAAIYGRPSKVAAGFAEGGQSDSAGRARRIPQSGRRAGQGRRADDRRGGVQRRGVGSGRGDLAGGRRCAVEIAGAVCPSRAGALAVTKVTVVFPDRDRLEICPTGATSRSARSRSPSASPRGGWSAHLRLVSASCFTSPRRRRRCWSRSRCCSDRWRASRWGC